LGWLVRLVDPAKLIGDPPYKVAQLAQARCPVLPFKRLTGTLGHRAGISRRAQRRSIGPFAPGWHAGRRRPTDRSTEQSSRADRWPSTRRPTHPARCGAIWQRLELSPSGNRVLVVPDALPRFPVVDVSDWRVLALETAGSDEKVWIASESGERALFKPNRAHPLTEQGEDWAEKLVSEVAGLLGVPAAAIDLATRSGARGASRTR